MLGCATMTYPTRDTNNPIACDTRDEEAFVPCASVLLQLSQMTSSDSTSFNGSEDFTPVSSSGVSHVMFWAHAQPRCVNCGSGALSQSINGSGSLYGNITVQTMSNIHPNIARQMNNDEDHHTLLAIQNIAMRIKIETTGAGVSSRPSPGTPRPQDSTSYPQNSHQCHLSPPCTAAVAGTPGHATQPT